jgi:hypothetical protein
VWGWRIRGKTAAGCNKEKGKIFISDFLNMVRKKKNPDMKNIAKLILFLMFEI